MMKSLYISALALGALLLVFAGGDENALQAWKDSLQSEAQPQRNRLAMSARAEEPAGEPVRTAANLRVFVEPNGDVARAAAQQIDAPEAAANDASTIADPAAEPALDDKLGSKVASIAAAPAPRATTPDPAPEPAPAPAPVAAAPAAPADPMIESGVRFTIGDRIEVRVFEAIQRAGGQATSYIERGDLSGEMLVEAGGVAYAPFVGAVKAYDRSPEALAAEIAAHAETMLGFKPRVTVKATVRQPVFVAALGGGAQALDFQPGMLLMQALSRAGGAPQAQDALWQRIDLAREEERLRTAERTLARMQAKQAVLEGEIAAAANGKGTPDKAALAARLTSAARAELEQAIALRTLEREEIEQKKHSFTSEIALIDQQIADFKEQLADSAASLSEAALRANHSRRLFERGHTNKQTLTVFDSHLREEKQRNQALRSAVMQLDSRRLEVSNSLAALEVSANAALRRELDAAKNSITEAQGSIDAIARWIEQAGAQRMVAAADKAKGEGPAYRLCRATPSGVDCQDTDDLYLALRPGDMVTRTR